MRPQLKNKRGKFFLTHHDVNNDPLKSEASVQPLSYTDPLRIIIFIWSHKQTKQFQFILRP